MPNTLSPLPPSMPIYIPLNNCNRPYQIPTYYPPSPYCSTSQHSCHCGGTCGHC